MRKSFFVVLLASTLAMNGCFGVSQEFRDYQKDFARYSGIKRAKKDIELSFGRFSLYFAEKLTGYIDRDLLAEMTIHDVSKFEIGVYEIVESDNNQFHYNKNLQDKGWMKFITTRSSGDNTNIYLYIDNDGDEIEQMIVEIIESDNIILIRLEGSFNRIVNRLIKARKLALR